MVGAFGFVNAFGAVAQGRLMDRLGQGSVLRAAAVVHVLGLSALVVAAEAGASTVVLAAAAAVGGSSLPSSRPPCGRCGACSSTTRSCARPPTR